jgi:hypothetical protein
MKGRKNMTRLAVAFHFAKGSNRYNHPCARHIGIYRNEVIVSFISHLSTKMKMSDQFQDPVALSSGKRRNRKVCGLHGRSEGFGQEKNPLSVPGIEISILAIPVT